MQLLRHCTKLKACTTHILTVTLIWIYKCNYLHLYFAVNLGVSVPPKNVSFGSGIKR